MKFSENNLNNWY